jgi:S-DNA-T family DNA segregation ATPase FtsK/SpoIIIE
MSVTVVRRSQRQPRPPRPTGEVVLDEVPAVPRASGRLLPVFFMALPLVAGAAGMALLAPGSKGRLSQIAGALYGVSFLASILVTAFTRNGDAGKAKMMDTRRTYMRGLEHRRATVRRTIARQRAANRFTSPSPQSLWQLASTGRLWERRPGDEDFGLVRIAVGDWALATPIVAPPTAPMVENLEPTCARAARRFERAYRTVPEHPIALFLPDLSRLHLEGDRSAVLGLARAMVGQLVTFHAPDDLLLAWCVADERRPDWEWAKWLPHALHPTKTDPLGQVRLVADSIQTLEARLDTILAGRPRFTSGTAGPGPRIVVLLDGGDLAGSDLLMTEHGLAGVTLIDLASPPPRMLNSSTWVLTIDTGRALHIRTIDQTWAPGRADQLGARSTEALARQLAPLRLSAGPVGATGTDRPTPVELGDLLGLGGPDDYDPAVGWAARPRFDRLRARFGVDGFGRPVDLDLKESAQGGVGPHGLLVGASGAGKSELMRTLLISLAMTHSPEIVNFVLVDFKGGAAFKPFAALPHTSAVVTNLEDDPAQIERLREALNGELDNRMRQLGPYKDREEYERARREGTALVPLPSLLIIVDEFSELLAADHDFATVLNRIATVGRSVGVHLLLAAPQINLSRLQAVEAQISYRLCLRTNNEAESRLMMHSDAAVHLKGKGAGYLVAGSDEPVRFQAAYVSGAVQGPADPSNPQTHPQLVVDYYTTDYRDPTPAAQAAGGPGVARPEGGDEDPESSVSAPKLYELMIARLSEAGRRSRWRARRVWLDPLSVPATLDQLFAPEDTADPAASPFVVDPDRGLTAARAEQRGGLRAAIGVEDLPARQRQDVLTVDLSGADGNLAVIGGQQSGKSNLLRMLVTSLALGHPPREAQFYILDLRGSLQPLAGLPQVGGVAGRRDVEPVRRTVAELVTLLHRRQEMFTEHRVEGMSDYRRRAGSGELPDDGRGDVFLVIDDWATLRAEFDGLMPQVTTLLREGLGAGIHVLASCARPAELGALADQFGTKIELRLGDPSLSAHRKRALNVPNPPGHGLTPAGRHFLTGLPRIDSQPHTTGLAEALTSLISAVRAAAPGAAAPPVRLLPREITQAELAQRPTIGPGLPMGIGESDLGVVSLDLERDPRVIIIGEGESGKSQLLRSIAHAVGDRYTPNEARIIMVDHGRSPALADARHWRLVLKHCVRDGVTGPVLREAADSLRRRLDSLDAPEPAARRYPDVFVLVDDYDLVATSLGNPLQSLLDLIPHARDLGLRLVVTRRLAGAGGALSYDPVLRTMVATGATRVLLSGTRGEGKIFDRLPEALVPGRGWVESRRSELVQFALAPPPRPAGLAPADAAGPATSTVSPSGLGEQRPGDPGDEDSR